MQEDGRVGLGHTHDGAHRHHPEAREHAQAGEMGRKGAVPVAHDPQQHATPVEGIKHRQGVIVQAKAQRLDEQFGGHIRLRRTGAQSGGEHASALGPQCRKARVVSRDVHAEPVVANLRGQGMCHAILGNGVARLGKKTGQHRYGGLQVDEGAERIKQYRTRADHAMEPGRYPQRARRTPRVPASRRRGHVMDPSPARCPLARRTAHRVGRDPGARTAWGAVLYSMAVPASIATPPAGGTTPGTRNHPRPLVIGLAVGAALVTLWAPSFVATAYVEGSAEPYLANPAKGWAFLWEAVTASRAPRLGTAAAAEQVAEQVWAGRPAVADDVHLAVIETPWRVPVPPGAVRVAPGRRVANPPDDLQWIVSGHVDGGPAQVIGLLDYRTGRVAWDIRPLPGGVAG